jgi:uncharacterized delta-60 repeat protein
MGLQSNGSISLNDIAGEFGGSTPHSLNEYYGAASGIPGSGQISFSNFYGASSENYWIATLGGPGPVAVYGIGVDSSGNSYVGGYSSEYNSTVGGHDCLIAKYNRDGAIQWQRTLGGTGTEFFHDIAVDSSGNSYAVGYSESSALPPAGPRDFIIAKYNTSGTLQWQKSFGTASSDVGQGIAVDSSGNVYVTGYFSVSGRYSDFVIAKLSTSGTIQWQRTLYTNVSDNANGIAVDSSGNVYVVGTSDSDVLTAKYNNSGVIQWQRKLGKTTSSDIGQGIAVDSSGNVYVIGYTNANSYNDILIAKYNTSGTIQWSRTFGGTSSEFGYEISVDSLGNVYITGHTQSSGAGLNDVVIAKLDTSGNVQWQRTLGTTYNEFGYGIAVGSSGVIYVAGTTRPSSNITNVLIAKLPGDGSLTSTYGSFTYTPSSFSNVPSAMTDSNGPMYDLGSSLTISSSSLTDRPALSLTSSITTF